MAARRAASSLPGPSRAPDLPGEAGPDDLLLDRQLCFSLYAASRAVVRAYGPLLDAHGLTYPQYVVLLALWGEDGRRWTVGELGDAVQLDGGTLTPLLKRLERDGWVRRRRDTGDERRVVVEVTPEGWALRDRVIGVPRALAGQLGLTLEDGVRLKRQLDELTRVLRAAEASGSESAPGSDGLSADER